MNTVYIIMAVVRKHISLRYKNYICIYLFFLHVMAIRLHF